MWMDKPTKMPRWADNGGTIDEPSEAKKDVGCIAERPTFGNFNWLYNLIYQWLTWFSFGSEARQTGIASSPEQALAFGLTYVDRKVPTATFHPWSVSCMKYIRGYIYAAAVNYADTAILKINPADGTFTTLYTGASASVLDKLEFDGTNLWVIQKHTSKILVISLEDGSLVHEIDTSTTVDKMVAMCFDGTYIWVNVLDSGTDKVLKIHHTTYATTTITHASFSDIRGMCFDGDYVWVTNYTTGNGLSKIDVSTNAVTNPITWGGYLNQIVFDGKYLFVTDLNDAVFIFDAATSDLMATISLTAGDLPGNLVFDGISVWFVKEGANGIFRVDRRSFTITGSALFASTAKAICFDGNYVWAGNLGDAPYLKIAV